MAVVNPREVMARYRAPFKIVRPKQGDLAAVTDADGQPMFITRDCDLALGLTVLVELLKKEWGQT